MTSKHTQEVVLEGGPEELPKEILLTCQEEASNEGFVKIKVHHFSAIRDVRKLYLDPVTIHGKQWRILIFPQGNQAESISLYLDYVGPKEGRWAVCADFAIAIEAEDQIHTREAQHRYCEDEGDWGFTNFIPKKFFYSEEKGKRVLVDDTLTLILAVRVLRDPNGILWHNFNNYDSKLETGFVGLKNQGATCYMNSILQSLYFTNYLRRAVFRMPTEDDDPAKSIPLALQRVFYHLQFSSKPVGTTELTKSFGWDAIDSFMQHDVQEFNRVLCDKLETKMKGTPVEGTINYLLEGKMKSFIRCMDVDFESSREESFYDIQLNVKGFKTLKESFDDYIQEETLEGDNKYFAEGHGLQRAKKGIIFTKLPPVLHLQLKRFEYDMMKDAMVKINDHHEFPESIDLSKYLDPATRTDEPQVYHLHGVLVHSGDLHGGHYCAFIRPETGGEWFKFDDDRVTKCLQREAMNDNFGIDPDAPKDAPRVVSRFSKKFTNAYMLVYVRETDTAKVLCPVLETDVNQAARERFLLEQKMEEERRREKEEQHLYMQIYIVTKEIMRNHHLTDLCSFDSKTSTPASALPLKVKKEATCQEFKELVAQKTGIPIERQRLWMMAKRQNGTIRPDECLDRFTDETMYSIKETLKVHTDPKIFVEESSVDPAVEGNVEYFEPLSPSDILLFVKSYDPSKSLLSFDDHFIVKKNEKPSDLAVRIQERNKQPFEHTLKFYEEIRPTMIERIKNKETWQTLEIGVGDIVCYSQDLPQEEMAQYEHATPKEYYDYIQNSITVHFKERNSPKDPSKQFSLQLSKKNNYDTVAEAVAKHLNTTPLMLRFTSHNHYTEMPKQEFKREPTKPLTDMLQPNQYQPATDILYYEVLEIPITELENKKAVTLSWVNSKLVEENTFKLLVEKDATAEQLVEILRQKLLASSGAAPAQTSVGSPGMVASPAPILDSPKDSDTEMKDAPEVAETSGAPPAAAAPAANSASPKPLQGTGEIRLIEIFNNRISKVIPKEEPIKSINEYSSFYAEEIPADQISIPEGDQLVSVFHFHKDPYSSHGIPFLFVLKQGEHFKDTLVRLQQRLAISDKEFEKYKVAFVSFGRVKYITEDDAVLAETKFSYNDYLALDHVDKTPRQSRSHYEKAIVIRN